MPDGGLYIAGDLKVGGAITAGSVSDTTEFIPTATPATAGAAGITGQIVWDSGFIYICTATNTWKRVGIATW